MAILSPNPSVRMASVRSLTDVSLAILSLKNFKFICEKYPEFERKVRTKAMERAQAN
jgi:hypothetical protein